jgi:cytosine/uracil/thiamine/allantoin permease
MGYLEPTYSFWVINNLCISNVHLVGFLVALGMSKWQSMIYVIIGKVVIELVAVTNRYVGGEWHIELPVYFRLV